MVPVRGSVEREQFADSMSALRRSASRLSKILVRNFLDSARIRGSDPVELYRLGKLLLESIRFRRSLLERRRGPKWSEENELRRMERQVWKVMSKLDKNPGKGRLELARFSKDLKQIMSDYGNTKAKPPHQYDSRSQSVKEFLVIRHPPDGSRKRQYEKTVRI